MATPFPQLACDRAELLSRCHPIETVAELIGAHLATVYRMKNRGWRPADYSSQHRPMPTDFEIMARKMTHRQLMAHYHCGPRALRRWFTQRPARPPFKPGKRAT